MQQVEIIVQEPVTGPEPARLVYYAKRPATLTLLSVRDDALKLLQSRQTSSISNKSRKLTHEIPQEKRIRVTENSHSQKHVSHNTRLNNTTNQAQEKTHIVEEQPQPITSFTSSASNSHVEPQDNQQLHVSKNYKVESFKEVQHQPNHSNAYLKQPQYKQPPEPQPAQSLQFPQFPQSHFISQLQPSHTHQIREPRKESSTTKLSEQKASLEELQQKIKRKNEQAKATQQQKEVELLRKIKLLRESTTTPPTTAIASPQVTSSTRSTTKSSTSSNGSASVRATVGSSVATTSTFVPKVSAPIVVPKVSTSQSLSRPAPRVVSAPVSTVVIPEDKNDKVRVATKPTLGNKALSLNSANKAPPTSKPAAKPAPKPQVPRFSKPNKHNMDKDKVVISQRSASPPSRDTSDLESLSGLTSDEESASPVAKQPASPKCEKPANQTDSKSESGSESSIKDRPAHMNGNGKDGHDSDNDSDATPSRKPSLSIKESAVPELNTLKNEFGLSDSESSSSSSPDSSPRRPKPPTVQQHKPISKPPTQSMKGTKRKGEPNKPIQRPSKAPATKPTKDQPPQPRTHSYPYAHDELATFMKKQAQQREKQRKREMNAKKTEQKTRADKMRELDRNTRKVLTENLHAKRLKPSSSPPRSRPSESELPPTPLWQRIILNDSPNHSQGDLPKVHRTLSPPRSPLSPASHMISPHTRPVQSPNHIPQLNQSARATGTEQGYEDDHYSPAPNSHIPQAWQEGNANAVSGDTSNGHRELRVAQRNQRIKALQTVAEQLSQRLVLLSNQFQPDSSNATTTEYRDPSLLNLMNIEDERAEQPETILDKQATEQKVVSIGVRGLSSADHERRVAQQRWRASLAIQRVYRGFRVRKAIRPLLSRVKPVFTSHSNGISTPITAQEILLNNGDYHGPYSGTMEADSLQTPPESPHFYARYNTPSPPREPQPSYASYSPLASPPMQPDHMSIINIFTRGVLDGKYRVAMEDNGLLSLSLNKPTRVENADLDQVNSVIQNINQSIGENKTVHSPKHAPLPSLVLSPALSVGVHDGLNTSHYSEEELSQEQPSSPTMHENAPQSPTSAPQKELQPSPNSLYLQMQRELMSLALVEESRLQAAILEGNRAVTRTQSEAAILASVLAQNQKADERRTTLKHQYKVKEQQLRSEVESLKHQLQGQSMRDVRIQTDIPHAAESSQGMYEDKFEDYQSDFDHSESYQSGDAVSSTSKSSRAPSISRTASGSIKSEITSSPRSLSIRSAIEESLERASSAAPSIHSSLAASPIHSSGAGSPIRSSVSTPQSPIYSSEASSPIRSSVAESPIHSSVNGSPAVSSAPASPIHSSAAESPMHSSFPPSPIHSSVAASPIRSSAPTSPIHSSPASPIHSDTSFIHSAGVGSPVRYSIGSSPRTEQDSPIKSSVSTSPARSYSSPSSHPSSFYSESPDETPKSSTIRSPSPSPKSSRSYHSSGEDNSSGNRSDDEAMNAVLGKLEQEIGKLERRKLDLSSSHGPHFRSKLRKLRKLKHVAVTLLSDKEQFIREQREIRKMQREEREVNILLDKALGLQVDDLDSTTDEGSEIKKKSPVASRESPSSSPNESNTSRKPTHKKDSQDKGKHVKKGKHEKKEKALDRSISEASSIADMVDAEDVDDIIDDASAVAESPVHTDSSATPSEAYTPMSSPSRSSHTPSDIQSDMGSVIHSPSPSLSPSGSEKSPKYGSDTNSVRSPTSDHPNPSSSPSPSSFYESSDAEGLHSLAAELARKKEKANKLKTQLREALEAKKRAKQQKEEQLRAEILAMDSVISKIKGKLQTVDMSEPRVHSPSTQKRAKSPTSKSPVSPVPKVADISTPKIEKDDSYVDETFEDMTDDERDTDSPQKKGAHDSYASSPANHTIQDESDLSAVTDGIDEDREIESEDTKELKSPYSDSFVSEVEDKESEAQVSQDKESDIGEEVTPPSEKDAQSVVEDNSIVEDASDSDASKPRSTVSKSESEYDSERFESEPEVEERNSQQLNSGESGKETPEIKDYDEDDLEDFEEDFEDLDDLDDLDDLKSDRSEPILVKAEVETSDQESFMSERRSEFDVEDEIDSPRSQTSKLDNSDDEPVPKAQLETGSPTTDPEELEEKIADATEESHQTQVEQEEEQTKEEPKEQKDDSIEEENQPNTHYESDYESEYEYKSEPEPETQPSTMSELEPESTIKSEPEHDHKSESESEYESEFEPEPPAPEPKLEPGLGEPEAKHEDSQDLVNSRVLPATVNSITDSLFDAIWQSAIDVPQFKQTKRAEHPRLVDQAGVEALAGALFADLLDDSVNHILHIASLKAIHHSAAPQSLALAQPQLQPQPQSQTAFSRSPTPSPPLSPSPASSSPGTSPTSSPHAQHQQQPTGQLQQLLQNPSLSLSNNPNLTSLPNIFARPAPAPAVGVDKAPAKYVAEVLTFVGASNGNKSLILHPLPIDTFIQMEKTRRKTTSEEQQIYNKLLFDSVNEAITTTQNPTPAAVMQKVTKWANAAKQGDDVLGLITQEQRDPALWGNSSQEREGLLREVVASIFDDLLADTVQSFRNLDLM